MEHQREDAGILLPGDIGRRAGEIVHGKLDGRFEEIVEGCCRFQPQLTLKVQSGCAAPDVQAQIVHGLIQAEGHLAHRHHAVAVSEEDQVAAPLQVRADDCHLPQQEAGGVGVLHPLQRFGKVGEAHSRSRCLLLHGAVQALLFLQLFAAGLLRIFRL